MQIYCIHTFATEETFACAIFIFRLPFLFFLHLFRVYFFCIRGSFSVVRVFEELFFSSLECIVFEKESRTQNCMCLCDLLAFETSLSIFFDPPGLLASILMLVYCRLAYKTEISEGVDSCSGCYM